MNGLNKEVISLVADASGDATVYSKPHYGLLYSVFVTKGTIADNADITISTDGGDFNRTLLTITNLVAGTAGAYYPRADSCTTAGAATAGTNDVMMVVDGRIKIVLAQGGNAGAGSITLSWIEDIV